MHLALYDTTRSYVLLDTNINSGAFKHVHGWIFAEGHRAGGRKNVLSMVNCCDCEPEETPAIEPFYINGSFLDARLTTALPNFLPPA
jgi:hypothetical protein